MKRSIFIIILLFLPAFGLTDDKEVFKRQYSEKTQEAKRRLEILHKAAIKYMIDNKGVWPQIPFDSIQDQQDLKEWWIRKFEPYGVDPDVWSWPDMERNQIAFLMTFFEDVPLKAFKWSRQPWFLANFRIGKEKATYMVFADGDILQFHNLNLNKAGKRRESIDRTTTVTIPEELRKFQKMPENNGKQ